MNYTAITIIVVLLSSAIILLVILIFLRSLRISNPNPKYIPTSTLKRRWRNWNPRSKYRLVGRSRRPNNNDYPHSLHSPTRDSTSYNPTTRQASTEIPTSTIGVATSSNTGATTNASTTETTSTNPTTVDRNTSVRSIMTLPAYYPTPLPSERLIAREGERGGVDTVIEFPETADEEEERREAEMDSLYQIRAARRREQEEREERRRQRHEAQQAGDWARLEQLRIQSRMRARAASGASAGSSATSLDGNPNSAHLIAEHAATNRNQRVSSVSYADLGLARHDGSRLRADSMESDHRPLLDSAASMGAGGAGSRRGSLFNVVLPGHSRARSASSVLSADSDMPDTPRTSTHGDRSGSGSDPPPRTPNTADSNESDLGEHQIPALEPPGYDENLGALEARGRVQEVVEEEEEEEEEAPPYESPVRMGPPQLPFLTRLPAIEVTGSTPASSVQATPVERTESDGGWGRR